MSYEKQLPYVIAQGDTSNSDKIRTNFEYLNTKITEEAIVPVLLDDINAPDNSIYYSNDAGKLVYKDSLSVVHALY